MPTLKPPRTRATTPAETRRFDLEADARALHDAVSELVRIYQFRDRDKICCYDISVTQCYALETLLRSGPLQMGELASALYLDKSTTSRVVDALERKKYVERVPNPEDRRALALRITRAGRELNQRIDADLVEQQKALVKDLDPQLRASVTDVIERLARAAQARFRAGASCGAEAPSCCPPAGKRCG